MEGDFGSDIVKYQMMSMLTSSPSTYISSLVHSLIRPHHPHKRNPTSPQPTSELDLPISPLLSGAGRVELVEKSRDYWKTSRIGMKIGSLLVSIILRVRIEKKSEDIHQGGTASGLIGI